MWSSVQNKGCNSSSVIFPSLQPLFLQLPLTKQRSSVLALRKCQSSNRCIAVAVFSVSKSVTLPLVRAKSLQSCLTLCSPTDCSPPGSPVHGDSPGKNTGVGWGDLPDPGIEPFPLWQAGSLPLAPPGKPNSPPALSFFYSICFWLTSVLSVSNSWLFYSKR